MKSLCRQNGRCVTFHNIILLNYYYWYRLLVSRIHTVPTVPECSMRSVWSFNFSSDLLAPPPVSGLPAECVFVCVWSHSVNTLLGPDYSFSVSVNFIETPTRGSFRDERAAAAVSRAARRDMERWARRTSRNVPTARPAGYRGKKYSGLLLKTSNTTVSK